jgi:hypothetical protein
MRQGNINSMLLRKRNSIHFCENRKTVKYDEKIFFHFQLLLERLRLKKCTINVKSLNIPLQTKWLDFFYLSYT